MHWFGGFRRRWIWELGGKASLKTPTKVCNPPSPDGPSQFPLLPSGHLHKYAFHRPSIMSGQLILSLIIPWETTVWKLSVQFFANEIGLHLCVCMLNLSSLFQSVIVTLWQGYLCCICICVCVSFTRVHCFSVWQGYLCCTCICICIHICISICICVCVLLEFIVSVCDRGIYYPALSRPLSSGDYHSPPPHPVIIIISSIIIVIVVVVVFTDRRDDTFLTSQVRGKTFQPSNLPTFQLSKLLPFRPSNLPTFSKSVWIQYNPLNMESVKKQEKR